MAMGVHRHRDSGAAARSRRARASAARARRGALAERRTKGVARGNPRRRGRHAGTCQSATCARRPPRDPALHSLSRLYALGLWTELLAPAYITGFRTLGRAECTEKWCQYVTISMVNVA